MTYDPLNSQLVGERTLHRNEKRCPDCRQTKPHEEWGPNRARYDGLQASCRPCQHQRANHSFGGVMATVRHNNKKALDRINEQVKEALS